MLALLSALSESEQSVLSEIYHNYSRDMFRIAYSILRNEEDAKDVVQTTIEKISKRLEDIDPMNRFRTKGFVLLIAKNQAINLYNKRKRIVYFDNEIILSDNHENCDVVIREVLASEREHLVENAINRLNQREAQIITLRYFYDLSYKEISTIMDCTESTARVILHRAKESVRDLLSEESFHEREA